MNKILIIEDDLEINALLADFLKEKGYAVHCQYDGLHVLDFLNKEKIDLIILDIMLPYRSGDIILSDVRKKFTIPVIIISAKETTQNKIDLLRLGADDYITKPFGTGELMARIRTSLRHSHAQTPGHVYKALDLEIDFEKRLIRLRGEEVHLTQIEYQLLTLLAENSGRVLTYSYIMNAIWGPYMDNNNQILRVNMANIRRKLEQNPAQPQYVFTEIGVGYRMRENENGGTV